MRKCFVHFANFADFNLWIAYFLPNFVGWNGRSLLFHFAPLHRDFSSRACDARAFPGILHFLLSQPSHLASRCHAFQIGIISPTFQKKRRRFLEKRWSFSKKRRSFFQISRMFFLCWSDSFWKTLLSFLFIFGAFFHHFSSVFLEKRDWPPKNPS